MQSRKTKLLSLAFAPAPRTVVPNSTKVGVNGKMRNGVVKSEITLTGMVGKGIGFVGEGVRV